MAHQGPDPILVSKSVYFSLEATDCGQAPLYQDLPTPTGTYEGCVISNVAGHYGYARSSFQPFPHVNFHDSCSGWNCQQRTFLFIGVEFDQSKSVMLLRILGVDGYYPFQLQFRGKSQICPMANIFCGRLLKKSTQETFLAGWRRDLFLLGEYPPKWLMSTHYTFGWITKVQWRETICFVS